MYTCIIFASKCDYHLALLGYSPFTKCLLKDITRISNQILYNMKCYVHTVTNPAEKMQSYLNCLYFYNAHMYLIFSLFFNKTLTSITSPLEVLREKAHISLLIERSFLAKILNVKIWLENLPKRISYHLPEDQFPNRTLFRIIVLTATSLLHGWNTHLVYVG